VQETFSARPKATRTSIVVAPAPAPELREAVGVAQLLLLLVALGSTRGETSAPEAVDVAVLPGVLAAALSVGDAPDAEVADGLGEAAALPLAVPVADGEAVNDAVCEAAAEAVPVAVGEAEGVALGSAGPPPYTVEAAGGPAAAAALASVKAPQAGSAAASTAGVRDVFSSSGTGANIGGSHGWYTRHACTPAGSMPTSVVGIIETGDSPLLPPLAVV
jgi:hypothetical protein